MVYDSMQIRYLKRSDPPLQYIQKPLSNKEMRLITFSCPRTTQNTNYFIVSYFCIFQGNLFTSILVCRNYAWFVLLDQEVS